MKHPRVVPAAADLLEETPQHVAFVPERHWLSGAMIPASSGARQRGPPVGVFGRGEHGQEAARRYNGRAPGTRRRGDSRSAFLHAGVGGDGLVDLREHGGHAPLRRRRGRQEAQAFASLLEGAIRDEAVQMHVEAEVAAKALHRREHPGVQRPSSRSRSRRVSSRSLASVLDSPSPDARAGCPCGIPVGRRSSSVLPLPKQCCVSCAGSTGRSRRGNCHGPAALPTKGPSVAGRFCLRVDVDAQQRRHRLVVSAGLSDAGS